ncbi:unnamed protein product, partial [Adineta ricciae]
MCSNYCRHDTRQHHHYRLFHFFLVTNYTTYQDPTTNQTFYAQIAALTVLGTIDNQPPSGTARHVFYGGIPTQSTDYL